MPRNVDRLSARLALLRPHPIFGLEVFSCVGAELPVAWMIDRFHSDDFLHQAGIMLADVFHQLGLGVGWSRHKNRTGVRNRLSDCLKEGVILRGMPAADGVRLM